MGKKVCPYCWREGIVVLGGEGDGSALLFEDCGNCNGTGEVEDV